MTQRKETRRTNTIMLFYIPAYYLLKHLPAGKHKYMCSETSHTLLRTGIADNGVNLENIMHLRTCLSNSILS